MSATTLPAAGSRHFDPSTINVTSARVVRPVRELYRRQPQLAHAAAISLLAIVPCLLAMLVDTRTTNDISVWIKPTKFLLSFVVYYATLAWAFGYLPKEYL